MTAGGWAVVAGVLFTVAGSLGVAAEVHRLATLGILGGVVGLFAVIATIASFASFIDKSPR